MGRATCLMISTLFGLPMTIGLGERAVRVDREAVIYVDAGASGAGDGSSWADAFTSVQAGLDAAAAGDQVWVAAGRYVENIRLVDGVALYGGFGGDEDAATFDLAERDFGVKETILDGNQARSVVTATHLTHEATRIDGFTITNGYSSYAGGGVYLEYSSPTIANNEIRGNSARRHGGGLLLVSSHPTIANNLITGNSAASDDGEGGGLYLSASSATIVNNTIAGNSAVGRDARGGGLYASDSTLVIVNNTIAGNSAVGRHAEGGGLWLHSSSATIANTIIAFNSSGVSASGNGPLLRHNCVYGNVEYDYAWWMDDPSGTDGNISEDPLFANPAYGDWHIQPDSPCVDAGDNDFVFGESDIDGEPRIQPAGGTVDMGADESDGTVWPAGPHVIVRVGPDGDDDNDGSSWALAKRTVQAAIAVATELGGEVWVATGTYYERVTLRPYAYVYGGFAGTESERGQRDWVANETVLNGEQAGSVVTAHEGYRSSALDGFTVTNGLAEYGGGLYLHCASPLIAHNTITGNSAERCGGGLYLYRASPLIADNTITSNSALAPSEGKGGGLYLEESSPTITNNKIRGSSAGHLGGGLYLSESSPTIVNNMITGNSASRPTYTGEGVGGGLYLRHSTPMIVSNTIADNSARDGSGLYLDNSSPMIVNNTITGNSGGQQGGGLSLGWSSAPTIANTIIAFNSSGILVSSSEPILRHNCVYGNAEYDYSGLEDPTGANGNISADPLFADRAYGNWHIQPDSPCVDAGDSECVLGEFDIDGEPRIQPAGGTVDIGADESDGTIWPTGPYVIVRVSAEGDDGHDGSSWALAKRTVQAAIDGASELGGNVWVAAGTYYERITLLPHAYVYGGFTGSESELEQRDWVSNVTVLDGQHEGSVVTALTGLGVSRLDGFTVTNGNALNGGGVHLAYSSPTIANNAITGNTAVRGGGLRLLHSPSMIVGNTITGNTAAGGGGLSVSYSSPMIANNTITGNTATGLPGHGGGLHLSQSSPTIASTIVAFNSSGVYLYYGDLSVLKHNCVYGNAEYDYLGINDPTGIDGNISEDPLFVLTPGPGPDGAWGTEDDELGDLRLSAGSPCIDAGDNAYVPEFVTTDLDGNPRFVDGSGDGVATVDMGAYEYQFRPGDLNCDGHLNVFDIDPFILALTGAFDEPPFAGYLAAYPDCDPRLADVNGDGLVNVFDIDPFVQLLTGGG